jgi:Protein of unknown function (DUF2800)
MTETLAHSNLGASNSKRWIACAGSVKMCANLPKSEHTKYTLIGTAAHALGEVCIINGKFLNPHDFIGCNYHHFADTGVLRDKNGIYDADLEFTDSKATIEITEEIVEDVEVYVDAVKEYFNNLSGSILYAEKRFSLASLHPSMFGTNDACILQPFGKLVVIDYKNGFQNVEVEDNTQLIYYAVGAAMDFNFEFTEIEMVIVQPNAFGQNPVKTYTIDNLELLEWRDKLKYYAEKTDAEIPELKTGSHCEYCPAAIYGCPAFDKMRDEALKDMFHTPTTTEITPQTDFVITSPENLTNEQISRLLLFCESFSKYEKAVQAEAFNRAEKGAEIPEYMLAEGRKGHRKWSKEQDVIDKFSKQYGDEIYEEPALLSPAQMEKLVGKKEIEGLTYQPDGKLTLVKADSKRVAVEPPKDLTAMFFA